MDRGGKDPAVASSLNALATVTDPSFPNRQSPTFKIDSCFQDEASPRAKASLPFSVKVLS